MDEIQKLLYESLEYLTEDSLRDNKENHYFSAQRVLFAVDLLGKKLPRKMSSDEVDFHFGGLYDEVKMIIAEIDNSPLHQVRLYRTIPKK